VQDVVLKWATYSEAAAQCGRARTLAGVHIQADADGGNPLGRGVARKVFDSLSCAFRGMSCCAPKLV
jgi:hypothetical protein